ncbi:hypothetical protein HOP50_10g58260 [Chloropicon primus]|nr:hypothetical protein HOP50_10g58260 [Chloropicon primus]
MNIIIIIIIINNNNNNIFIIFNNIARYLEDLEGDESRGLERWFYTDYLNQRKGRRARRRDQAKALADASSDGIDLDEELDRAEEEASAADPNFLSLDNPIVVATVSLALFTAFAALQGKA